MAYFVWILLFVAVEHVLSTLRLVPGPTIGRLEVLHNGEWGTVCDDKFGYEEAKVACRQLGYTSLFNLPWGTKYGKGTIWLDNLTCSGSEKSLSNCAHSGWGKHDCTHSEDIGLYCSDDIPIKIIPESPLIKTFHGEKFSLKCERKDGKLDEDAITWYFKGKSYKWLSVIFTVRSHISDDVICNWRDSTFEANATTTIHSLRPPTSSLNTGSKRVFEGDRVSICLDVSSDPEPDRFEWRKSGVRQAWTNSSSCPTIDSVQRSDAGDYVINIYNTMVSTFNKTKIGKGALLVSLDVLYPPSLSCPSEIEALFNSTLDLKCEIDAFPPENSITWYLDSEVSGSREIGHEASFRMAGLELTDGGVYVCRVRNNMTDDSGLTLVGEAKCRTKLTVLPPSKDPGITTSSDVTDQGGLTSLLTIWIRYRWYILAGLGVVTLFSVCVTVLLVRRRKRPDKGLELTMDNLAKKSQKKKNKSTGKPNKEKRTYVLDNSVGGRVLDKSSSRRVSGQYWSECPDDISEGWIKHDWTGDQKTEDNIYTNTCVEADIYENVKETQDNMYQNTAFNLLNN